MKPTYKYLFGPVPSRRLGRSLGIDVTPFKTCSFDCLFCQCGGTTQHVSKRAEFVPFEEVCEELERWLSDDGAADVITFAGSGEPTLYSRLGDLIDFIQARTQIPVIVLTNGTLLNQPDVRIETAEADIVKVSLSAWDEPSYQRVNRPAPELTFASLLEGEHAFRSMFHGQLWLEVFLMAGINDAPDQVQQIAALVTKIAPDTIHLNTAVRPPAEKEVQPVSKKVLEQYRTLFSPSAEVIASFEASSSDVAQKVDPEELLDLIRRHPATAKQLAALANTTPESIQQALAPLLETKMLQTEMRDEELYYR